MGLDLIQSKNHIIIELAGFPGGAAYEDGIGRRGREDREIILGFAGSGKIAGDAVGGANAGSSKGERRRRSGASEKTRVRSRNGRERGVF